MTRTRISTSALWAAGAVLVSVAVPLLLWAGSADDAALKARRDRIAGMSAAERDRLLKKYREFLALPEGEREKLRALQDGLARERSLRAVMDEYEEWLTTVTPWQREALRQESSVARRIVMVRAIREEQRAEKRRQEEQDSRRMGWLTASNGQGPPSFLRRPRMRRSELAAVAAIMQVIEDSLPDAAQRDPSLQEAEGPARHARVLAAALREARESGAGGLPGRPGWPDPELRDTILDQISNDSRWRGFLEQSERPQTALIESLSWRIRGAWWEQAFRRTIDEDELNRVFYNLEPERREAMAGMRPEERRRRLHWLKLSREFENDPAMSALGEIVNEILPRDGRRPRPFGTPSEGPRPQREPADDSTPGSR